MQVENSRFDRNRQAIIHAALECFSRYGFDATSVKMIAQEAGAKSSAIIYYYFKDKDALLYACMDNTQVPKLEDIPEDTPPLDWAVRMMTDYLDMLAIPQFRKLILCAYSLISRRSDFLNEINLRFREPHRLRFYRFLDMQIENGVLAPMHYWSAYQEFYYPLSMRMLISGDWLDWNYQQYYMDSLRQRAQRFLRAYC